MTKTKKDEKYWKKIYTWFKHSDNSLVYRNLCTHKKKKIAWNQQIVRKQIDKNALSLNLSAGFLSLLCENEQFYHSLFDIIVSSINSFMKCSHFSNFAYWKMCFDNKYYRFGDIPFIWVAMCV